jgi:hypothetical protein
VLSTSVAIRCPSKGETSGSKSSGVSSGCGESVVAALHNLPLFVTQKNNDFLVEKGIMSPVS